MLTRYNGPRSVVHYCSLFNGRDANDYTPTTLDFLGMKMLYPGGGDHPIRSEQGCFTTGDGVIVRSDGRITSDWWARGAARVTMALSLSGTHTTWIGAEALPNGTAQVQSYLWNDSLDVGPLCCREAMHGPVGQY